jgi:hypothetical protein
MSWRYRHQYNAFEVEEIKRLQSLNEKVVKLSNILRTPCSHQLKYGLCVQYVE